MLRDACREFSALPCRDYVDGCWRSSKGGRNRGGALCGGNNWFVECPCRRRTATSHSLVMLPQTSRRRLCSTRNLLRHVSTVQFSDHGSGCCRVSCLPYVRFCILLEYEIAISSTIPFLQFCFLQCLSHGASE